MADNLLEAAHEIRDKLGIWITIRFFYTADDNLCRIPVPLLCHRGKNEKRGRASTFLKNLFSQSGFVFAIISINIILMQRN